MFRNQYDTDASMWSPQGRLHQVEYAAEAVNQGTVCVGLRSDKYVVLAALQRSTNSLASHQKKIMRIDDHLAIAMSGLTADGRSLVKYMRTEALNHKYVYGTAVQGSRLVSDVADMHQRSTQIYGKRPYGVGLLVAVVDQTGPHLYVTEPSGNYHEYYAMAIGSRSQTSRTYLEREFASLDGLPLEDLIKHAVKALASSLSGDSELDVKSTAVCVVGTDAVYRQLDDREVQRVLDEVTAEQSGEVETGVAAMELENPEL